MQTSQLYWGWAKHADDPDYEREIDRGLDAARTRILGATPGRPPGAADLLRLVDREFDRPDDPIHRLRRDRWQKKLDSLLTMVRPDQRVVDCGSGFGTEVIAFALAGARVTAVDLFPIYLRLLERRVALYGEIFGVDLSSRVRVVAAHLPTYEPDETFDYAWSNESIEHILPLEPFLRRLPGWLAEDGAAVICNDNALNPVRMLVTMRARGSVRARHVTHTSPDGTAVSYGNEIIRSPLSTRRMLQSAGFRSVELRMLSVVPSQLVRNDVAETLARRLEGLASVPAARIVAGGDYVAIARR
jgi:SAM-dependent methyltransferase